MSKELERRFLIVKDSWRDNIIKMEHIRDGFIFISDEKKVRIRDYGQHSTLTIKIQKEVGDRYEYEYGIPYEDADEMLELHCGENRIDKTRYYVSFNDYIWTIDFFEGSLKGIALAEIEYSNKNEKIPLPDWIGSEVTYDPEYDKHNMLRKLRNEDCGSV